MILSNAYSDPIHFQIHIPIHFKIHFKNSDVDLPRRWEASVDIWFKEWIRRWSSQVIHIPASINLRIPSGSQY